MHDIAQAVGETTARIAAAERRFGRRPGSVALIAVSKTRPVTDIRTAMAAGLHRFGESYVSEALAKIEALAEQGLEWHFIGPVQSNKTRAIASRFDWVHGIDRLKIARRLNDQRPAACPPLNVCIQVNVSGEPGKSGVAPQAAAAIAEAVARLPRLRLRGLMTIPAPGGDFATQRLAFRQLRELQAMLRARGLALDTLSMGMTADLEAAIAEGATLVRIGTGLFGERGGRRHDSGASG